MKVALERNDYATFYKILAEDGRIKTLSEEKQELLKMALLKKEDEINNKKRKKSQQKEGVIIITPNNLAITIKSTSKGLSKYFGVGMAIIDRTDPRDIEEFWDNLLYSIECQDIKDCVIPLLGDPKILGRSEEALSISRSYMIHLHKNYRIHIQMELNGSVIDATLEQNFNELKKLATIDSEYRAKKQYFEHKGIDRFTSYIKFLLRSKALLEQAIQKTVFEINKYNAEQRNNPEKGVLPPTEQEIQKITKNLITYIKNHHDIYNIPLYTPEEIKKAVELLRNIDPQGKIEKSTEEEKAAKMLAKVTGMTFEEALTTIISLKNKNMSQN